MAFKITPSTEATARRRQSGAFLAEYVITVGLTALLAVVLTSMALYSGRHFVAMTNYSDLNNMSVNAMDTLTREIRRCGGLTSCDTNKLVFSDGTNVSGLSFTYDPTNRTLVREQGGRATTLLTGCDSLLFSIYQRTPLTGTYDQYPVASNTDCKVVSVKWTCSRTIFGTRATTETDEEAKVVIRKH
jgi:Tfp pilus assembly protein PilW